MKEKKKLMKQFTQNRQQLLSNKRNDEVRLSHDNGHIKDNKEHSLAHIKENDEFMKIYQ
jgi:hypothetical protein